MVTRKSGILPHHAVFREDKRTTKCCVVFDALAYDEHELSLNDCILSGPSLQPNLVSVLLRFRTRRVALIADVEKMFLQIKDDESDQNGLRYLWRDLKSDDPPRIYKLQRLAFGVNCSPFLAIATVQSHATKCRQEFPDVSSEVLSNTYVDDCLTGDDDGDATVELMMERGGFNLIKWAQLREQEQPESSAIYFNASEQLKYWECVGIH